MSDPTATIVLVHGALTDASVWHGVIGELQRRSYRVLAPALPMRTLAGDVAYLRSVLATLDGSVVVAGHSYGGSVISDPAALTPEVRARAFIAAFHQAAGESAGAMATVRPRTGPGSTRQPARAEWTSPSTRTPRAASAATVIVMCGSEGRRAPRCSTARPSG